MKIIVYTAIFGGSDEPRTPKNVPGCRYMCFTDRKSKVPGWEYQIRPTAENPHMQAKEYKLLPDLFFDCDFSVWMDGNVKLLSDIRLLVAAMVGYDIGLFKPRRKRNIFQEARRCMKSHVGNPSTMRAQVLRYPRADLGIWSGRFIIRRHSEKVSEFNEVWWEEVYNWSGRDQLSLPYALRECGMKIKRFDGNSDRNKGVLSRVSHKQKRTLKTKVCPVNLMGEMRRFAKRMNSKDRGRNILVCGCARSATKYTAASLRNSGYDMGHETLGYDGIVTWTAVGGVREWEHIDRVVKLPSEFAKVVHQVRHPLQVIRSATTLMKKSWGYAANVYPLVSSENVLIRSMQYWLYWNIALEEFADVTLAVDQDGFFEKLADHLGVSALDALPDTRMNTRREGRYAVPALTWGMLASEDRVLATEIQLKAQEYGYQ